MPWRSRLLLLAMLGGWLPADTRTARAAEQPDEGVVIETGLPGFDYQGVEAYVPPGVGMPLSGELLYGRPWDFLARNLLVFGGVHGFKGPTDLGLAGNFGFHEGVNWGAPLWEPWGYGVQAGVQALHSNFLGNQAVVVGPLPSIDPADRNQLFFTAGVFQRRMESGVQGGMAFDVYYDNYFGKSTLYQLRSETALVFAEVHELGYWGAYGVSKDSIQGIGQFDSVLEPTDVFALFYRRRFTGGGQGRIWAGMSGGGDAVFGLDGTVPLGTNWALDNNFTCLFPKHGRGPGDVPQESWSVSIHLVWFPGRASRPVVSNPYHPLFYVADNSWFLVNRRR